MQLGTAAAIWPASADQSSEVGKTTHQYSHGKPSMLYLLIIAWLLPNGELVVDLVGSITIKCYRSGLINPDLPRWDQFNDNILSNQSLSGCKARQGEISLQQTTFPTSEPASTADLSRVHPALLNPIHQIPSYYVSTTRNFPRDGTTKGDRIGLM